MGVRWRGSWVSEYCRFWGVLVDLIMLAALKSGEGALMGALMMLLKLAYVFFLMNKL